MGECLSDPGGCYVILKGLLNNVEIILVCIYAPHGNQVPFWTEIYSHIKEQGKADILMFGDFNTIMDAKLDRSQVTTTPVLQTQVQAF